MHSSGRSKRTHYFHLTPIYIIYCFGGICKGKEAVSNQRSAISRIVISNQRSAISKKRGSRDSEIPPTKKEKASGFGDPSYKEAVSYQRSAISRIVISNQRSAISKKRGSRDSEIPPTKKQSAVSDQQSVKSRNSEIVSTSFSGLPKWWLICRWVQPLAAQHLQCR